MASTMVLSKKDDDALFPSAPKTAAAGAAPASDIRTESAGKLQGTAGKCEVVLCLVQL